MKKFKAGTGLMGCTEPNQRVTKENIHLLPPGSVVRNNASDEKIIHLHGDLWYRCNGCLHAYDTVDAMKTLLDKHSVLCHIPRIK